MKSSYLPIPKYSPMTKNERDWGRNASFFGYVNMYRAPKNDII